MKTFLIFCGLICAAYGQGRNLTPAERDRVLRRLQELRATDVRPRAPSFVGGRDPPQRRPISVDFRLPEDRLRDSPRRPGSFIDNDALLRHRLEDQRLRRLNNLLLDELARRRLISDLLSERLFSRAPANSPNTPVTDNRPTAGNQVQPLTGGQVGPLNQGGPSPNTQPQPLPNNLPTPSTEPQGYPITDSQGRAVTENQGFPVFNNNGQGPPLVDGQGRQFPGPSSAVFGPGDLARPDTFTRSSLQDSVIIPRDELARAFADRPDESRSQPRYYLVKN